jgi:hypothetical protein
MKLHHRLCSSNQTFLAIKILQKGEIAASTAHNIAPYFALCSLVAVPTGRCI